MRKRILIGNVMAVAIAGLCALLLDRTGTSPLATGVICGALVVALASVHAIRLVNELLGRVGVVEEAVLRVSHGEVEVRLGEHEPPFDGLAYRLDRLFELVDAANEPASDATPHAD